LGNNLLEDEYLTKDSVKFHERMGFVKVAEFHKCGCKFGHLYNVIWMEKMLGGHTPDPLPVRSFTAGEIRNRPCLPFFFGE